MKKIYEKLFSEHLKKSHVDYFSHLFWAVKAGFILIFAGITSILHGIIPKLFDGYAAKTVIKIYHERLKNHPNKEYEDLIKYYENKK